MAAESNNGLYQLNTPSPPKSEVDENSLQKHMDKNKESLKVKLMLRRPITQLIDQGIMPPLKTHPAIHEQRQKLERAKTGDILKSKIQRRPAREELIQQHILEDTTVDPSLQERQRLLKKARLQDDLNDRLSHRPGPLELIKGNILKTDEPLAQAIRDGQLTFRNTSEGELRKHPGPMFFYEEDSGSEGTLSPSQDSPTDGSSNHGALSVSSLSSGDGQRLHIASPASSMTMIACGIGADIRSPLSSLSSPSCASIGSPPATFATLPSTFSTAVPSSTVLTSTASSINQIRANQANCPVKQEPGGGKAARKKSKSKSQPKTRTIKFHEYKGPPNAQKVNNNSNLFANDSESTYDLLLQQQQLFLQWQLEWQHKYPQILLPAAQKNPPSLECTIPTSISTVAMVTTANCISTANPVATVCTSQPRQQSPPVVTSCGESGPGSPSMKLLSKLEDMKVSDLKAELKKRNLPVSGPKPQLIERLKPFSDQNIGLQPSMPAVMEIKTECCSPPPPTTIQQQYTIPSVSLAPHIATPLMVTTIPSSTMATVVTNDVNMTNLSLSPPRRTISPPGVNQRPPSVVPMDTEMANIAVDANDVNGNDRVSLNGSPTAEETLKRKIEELQRELQRSQLQLQKQQNIVQQTKQQPTQNSTTKMLQQHLQQKIQQQQNLQRQKLQQQQIQLLQQQQQLQQQLQQQKLQEQQLQQPVANEAPKQFQQTIRIPISATNSVTSNINVAGTTPMSLPTTLTGQLLISPTVGGQNVVTTAHIPFVALTNSNISLVNGCNGNVDVPSLSKTVRANSLPNCITLGHTRTNSLPSFTPPAALIQRTTTDPQFILARPPPAYDEATKQILNVVATPAVVTPDGSSKNIDQNTDVKLTDANGTKKASKNQAIEDVLEILIRNGELPPSVVQEPTTPNNKSSSEPPTFPTSPPTPATSIVDSQPMETTLDECIKNFISPAPSINHRVSNFDLDLELELEGLESMDLSNLTNGLCSPPTHIKPESNAPNSCINANNVLELVPASSTEEHINMDVDMSEWLDSIISPPATPATMTTITYPSIPTNVHNVYGNDEENDRDPMLSVTTSHDPFDMFSINDTDFKAPVELGWDRIDFAA